METRTESTLVRAGVDGVALKPTEHRLVRAGDLPVDLLTVDFEGREHLPPADTLRRLAAGREVRATVPVRADGFDPLGEATALEALPETVGRVFVAGHPAYLRPEERERSVAPRLRAAASDAPDPWIGTEGIERLALALGGTQFELLSGSTAADAHALRRLGVTDDLAVYAPLVCSDDPDTILDAVGDYAARRGSVAEALPAGAPTDSAATGAVRETLLRACREYALVGAVDRIAERVAALRDAGVDRVVAYPARGLDAVR